jgi:hypothetical protein
VWCRPIWAASLIFDLGVNDGSDTDFYLKKGFRVVGVEANPLVCEGAAKRFSQAIEAKRLTLAKCRDLAVEGTAAVLCQQGKWPLEFV